MFWLAVFGTILIWDSILRFALLCLRAVTAPCGTDEVCVEAPRGAILIAARNEAGTIGPTIRALREHCDEWPDINIWVLADRCTDDTASEAAAAGAQVAPRAEGPLGKGAVLAWWLNTYRAAWADDDYLIVLDADTRLEAGSLAALRRTVMSGAQVVQGFVVPQAVNRAGRLAGWSEVLMQRIDDEARQRLRWSVPLRGTGMIFQASLLAQLAPRLHTLAEDLELDSLLAAQSVRVRFSPAAKIIDPKPQQAAGASRQRARWLQGQLQVLRDYPAAIFQALTRGGLSACFLLWLLFLRPKMLLMAMRFAVLILALCFSSVGQGLALVMAFGLMLDAAYYLGGAAFVEEPWRYCRDLLAVPRYGAMWLYSFGLAAVRRGWLRAGR
jgi:cellulose synthase/poly-beta-1,6-N-acetylglucosamine synthase-like glycosyltransferase